MFNSGFHFNCVFINDVYSVLRRDLKQKRLIKGAYDVEQPSPPNLHTFLRPQFEEKKEWDEKERKKER